MLDKPKFLTGKVKEFIDTNYTSKYSNDPTCIYRWDIKYFYNQLFDPKMIEEYFKGWEFNGNRYLFNIFSIKFYGETFAVIIYGGKQISFQIPNTLSQFITFVLSAGITLEWRE